MPSYRSAPRLALASGAVLALALACWSPTEVAIDVSTDFKCDTISTAVFVDAQPGAATTADGCPEGDVRAGFTSIGKFMLAPGGARDARVDVRVVLSDARDTITPERCVEESGTSGDPTILAHCVFARRSFRFDPHQSEYVGVRLYTDCRGVVCDAQTTCEPRADGTTYCADSHVQAVSDTSSEGEPGDAGMIVDAGGPIPDAATDAPVDASTTMCTGPAGDGVLTAALPAPTSRLVYDPIKKRVVFWSNDASAVPGGQSVVAVDTTSGAVTDLWDSHESTSSVFVGTRAGTIFGLVGPVLYRLPLGATNPDASWTAESTPLSMSVGQDSLFVGEGTRVEQKLLTDSSGFVIPAWGTMAQAQIIGATPNVYYYANDTQLFRFSPVVAVGPPIDATTSAIAPQRVGNAAFACITPKVGVPEIVRVGPTGQIAVTTSFTQPCILAVDAIDEEKVYWVNQSSAIYRGSVAAAPTQVYPPGTVTGPGGPAILDIATDGTCLYFWTREAPSNTPTLRTAPVR